MDDPNITMEEYIRLEEEKARRCGKVYNWETATYGKIWYDEDVHDLRSVETEFSAIVFNDTLMFEPTVSSPNNNEIDFRISFDDSDDEDYMPTVCYFDDLDFFKDFENEFPAIVYNDALTFKLDFLSEPTITSTLKYKDVPESAIKIMLFPFSIDGPAQIWLDKEPSRSILTWDDLVSKFINHFLPPSKTTNLQNEISNFHQNFTELHQLDTFYNGLNSSDQDSLNSAVGGNLLERSAQDVLKIIENKSNVRNSRNKPIVSQVKASNVDSLEIASAVASAVTSAMTAMFKQHQVTPAPAFVKAVEESCVTCGDAYSYRQCPATDGNTFLGYQDNIQGYVSAAAVNYNQGNTGYLPQSVANQI
ncbi:reverse transcriptase domain-containing protein [Tanacetum coccineum]